jgi:hypothetical protein
MKDFIGNVATKDSCCPDLSWKTRMIGFAVCFLLGIALSIMGIGYIFTALSGNSNFALFWTLGNITSLCSYIVL